MIKTFTIKAPTQVYAPELHEGGHVFYFTEPVDYGDLKQKAKHFDLPFWLVDLISAKEKAAYWDGYKQHKNDIRKFHETVFS